MERLVLLVRLIYCAHFLHFGTKISLKSVELWTFQFRFRKKPSQLIFKLFLNTVDCKECFESKNRYFDNKTKR